MSGPHTAQSTTFHQTRIPADWGFAGHDSAGGGALARPSHQAQGVETRKPRTLPRYHACPRYTGIRPYSHGALLAVAHVSTRGPSVRKGVLCQPAIETVDQLDSVLAEW